MNLEAERLCPMKASMVKGRVRSLTRAEARRHISDAIEILLILLDEIDGDPDLERNIGAMS